MESANFFAFSNDLLKIIKLEYPCLTRYLQRFVLVSPAPIINILESLESFLSRNSLSARETTETGFTAIFVSV